MGKLGSHGKKRELGGIGFLYGLWGGGNHQFVGDGGCGKGYRGVRGRTKKPVYEGPGKHEPKSMFRGGAQGRTLYEYYQSFTEGCTILGRRKKKIGGELKKIGGRLTRREKVRHDNHRGPWSSGGNEMGKRKRRFGALIMGARERNRSGASD